MRNIIFVLLLSGVLIACNGENDDSDMPKEEQQEQMEDESADNVDMGEEAEDEAMDEEGNDEDADNGDENNDGTVSSQKTWTGKVVKLTNFVKGSSEMMSSDRVQELINAGQYVGFVSDGTFYMVYNAAGNYDWKNMAKAAGQNAVKVEGRMKSVGGISVIIASNMTM